MQPNGCFDHVSAEPIPHREAIIDVLHRLADAFRTAGYRSIYQKTGSDFRREAVQKTGG